MDRLSVLKLSVSLTVGRVEGGAPSSPIPCKLSPKQNWLGKKSTGASVVSKAYQIQKEKLGWHIIKTV